MNIDEFDIEELVRGMHDLSDDIDVYDFIFDEYEMDWSGFCSLIRNLVPLITVGQSPLSGKVYKGFGKDNMFFLKVEDTTS
jgi:hypothetical protein